MIVLPDHTHFPTGAKLKDSKKILRQRQHQRISGSKM